MRLILGLGLVLAMLIPGPTFAQEVLHLDDAGVLAPQAVALASATPTAAPASVAASAPAVASEAKQGVVLTEVLPTADEAKQVVDVFLVGKAAVQAPTVFGICAAVALFVNLLISFLRRRGKLASRKGVKKFLAFAVALSGGLAAVTPGMPIALAAFVALAPLLSVAGHEIFRSDK